MFKIIGGDRREYGPVTTEALRQWIAEGRANARTKVRAEGTTDWTSLGNLPEFASAFPSTTATPPPILTQPPPPILPVVAVNISTYLVPAILCTLCCCLPGGIVALVYSAQVSSKLAAGDVAGATAASRNAMLWCWISVGLGALSGISLTFFNLLGFMRGNFPF